MAEPYDFLKWVYDEMTKTDNILDEEVNKIIKDAAEEYNLIKVGDNAYIEDTGLKKLTLMK